MSCANPLAKPTNVEEKKAAPLKMGARPTIEDIYIEHLSYLALFFVYIAYGTALLSGYVRELLSRIEIFMGVREDPLHPPAGYAPLFKRLDYFWLTRMYQKIRDLFERPISTVPGTWINVLQRGSNDENASFYFTGEEKRCLNLASYNYLGFAENSGPVIDSVVDSISNFGTACGASRLEGGDFQVVRELEEAIARFVGKPSAMVVAMGYATNSTTIPALTGTKGTLIISDSLNHASIVCGSRDSGAKIRVFKHNDPEDLDRVLRDSIVEGQPRTRRPWKKIVIIVEGIYSMEGEIARLKEIVELKKKYKAYLYVDEAHSIGALGKTGRGVCEHTGVNPEDVDVLMGTFTKAFGSVGGYIASSEEIISYLRHVSYGSIYATAMSPPTAQQALSALKVIMGEDGTNSGQLRLQRLHDNSNFFRNKLLGMGFHVIGDKDSPIVPLMVYHPAKFPYLSRQLFKRGIVIVVVGFPVTPLLLSRIRFCISANHTREDLEWALEQISELGDIALLKYGFGDKKSIEGPKEKHD